MRAVRRLAANGRLGAAPRRMYAKVAKPAPSPEERIAFIRQMSSKKDPPLESEPEPEPEPGPEPESGPGPALQASPPERTQTRLRRSQTRILSRRESWRGRDASAANAETNERVRAALEVFGDTSQCARSPPHPFAAPAACARVRGCGRRVPCRVAPRVNIRRELEILSEMHPTIPFAQFLQLCRDNDLPELEARSMAKDLTASGVAAHFPDHGEPWADTLFLRPAEILRAFDAALGVGPKHNAGQADISRVRARHAAVECVATASARQLAVGSSGAPASEDRGGCVQAAACAAQRGRRALAQRGLTRRQPSTSARARRLLRRAGDLPALHLRADRRRSLAHRRGDP